MQHLRLVGVHEDGTHLLLTDDDGNGFALPLDEPLRAAARRDRPRLGQLQIEISGGLRPRDVQAMIRAGLSAEEVAERAGWAVEKVHRYEGPILAEREHVAGLARQARLRARGASHGGSPTLDARVSERLRSREIDLGSVRWDSRRTEAGTWTALLRFTAGGREREAAWHYDPLSRTVTVLDDEARWLSEDEEQQAPGPIPAPHLSASTRPSRVYDVEAEGGVSEPRDTGETRRATGVSASARRREGETVDLMAAMRERSAQRRGRRRPRAAEVPGLEDVPEEALPLEELARDPREELPPAAHTHPEDDPEVEKHGEAADRIGVEAAARKARRAERTQPVRQSDAAARPRRTERSEPSEDIENVENREHGETEPARADTGHAADLHRADVDGSRDTTDDTAGADNTADAEPVEDVRPAAPAVAAVRRAEPAHDAPEAADARDERGVHDVPDAPEPDDEESGELIEERATASDPRPTPPPRPAAARKSGRPSVPSWDDIMFGRRGD
ncbi:septation protein SepH [Intrasporangium sp. YIM S08009]|uniref:septation protein SepH n=1 Tax=Intrasporangium zincisolvens TaxID=3080018 RepID=UPI002B05C94E|nr:septation protein SepH [Intrasporangium sp. YIM S08009]